MSQACYRAAGENQATTVANQTILGTAAKLHMHILCAFVLAVWMVQLRDETVVDLPTSLSALFLCQGSVHELVLPLSCDAFDSTCQVDQPSLRCTAVSCDAWRGVVTLWSNHKNQIRHFLHRLGSPHETPSNPAGYCEICTATRAVQLHGHRFLLYTWQYCTDSSATVARVHSRSLPCLSMLNSSTPVPPCGAPQLYCSCMVPFGVTATAPLARPASQAAKASV